MLIDIIAGARPNFMKIAPIIRAIEEENKKETNINFRLIHTGQHFDKNMSGDFFDQLGIPEPHINLESGGGSQAEQTANIMVRFEKDLIEHPADLVLVVGDVTSTMACTIVAKKLNTKVAHVEAGIRSGDMTMPEEINRIVTDSITDYFFTTSDVAGNNLIKNGVEEERIFFVGNTMIDTLLKCQGSFKQPAIWDLLALQKGKYLMMTLHRPANVDSEENLRSLLEEIVENSHGYPLIFPVHPRTAKKLSSLGLKFENVHYVDPLGYLEFNYLVKHCLAVITDSGGITEETTVLGIPCMTLRDSTERPETCTIGSNELLGTNPKALAPAMQRLFNGQWKKSGIPPLWDGRAAERIIKEICTLYKV
ncbi:non-hydrolyzing UDP-N-acetylglucosamine 2-epimerase [Chitinophaga defluvii]|uniref:UDP-N-acetylglucosamine 2-epimerase (Non-hydrolyzing) n=1 Tax=Chitinophaga defluvii TaxID=3163343 RepID=A0ABV2T1T9_9BACT